MHPVGHHAAEPSRAEPSRAEPSRAEPSRFGRVYGKGREVEEGGADDVFRLPRYPCTRRLRTAVPETARPTS
ncbi:hypothetical protein GCM10014719_15870 [Planomonospora parontospora subsp. antibiotica]|nr:hypothetical protein GCM10014719_15870 [Planomonospora parontospora subsp. antibiotica]GII15862.1 hypothetical protein Ppa05_25880 [Planomonospora parontospora subsp. antibiotica]